MPAWRCAGRKGRGREEPWLGSEGVTAAFQRRGASWDQGLRHVRRARSCGERSSGFPGPWMSRPQRTMSCWSAAFECCFPCSPLSDALSVQQVLCCGVSAETKLTRRLLCFCSV